jgi:tetratricopeptide (TPR) repeat protein
MAKKEKKNDADQLEVVGEVIESAEGFLQKYKNVIIYSLVGIAVIVGGYFGYTELISKPHQREANEQMFRAEGYFAVDSFNLALNGDGNALGFLQIIDEYGSTKAGNLAHFYAGICYFRLNDFNAAIKEMGKFSANDELLAARALCVIGDSYVELNQLDDAVNYFNRAANKNNNSYSAMYLLKAAKVYEVQEKYNESLSAYEKIKKDYPQSMEARDIDKYIEKASLLAGK